MDPDPRLRLRHIRAFLAVLRAGGITAAAAELGMTQPAASKTVRELERILGASLFDRVGRGLRLSEAGRAFEPFAARAWADIGRAQRAAAGPGPGARLAAGVLPTAAADLFPRAALAFAAAHPGAALRAETGPNGALIEALRGGELDLVVGRMAAPEAMRGLTFEQLRAEEVALVCRPAHPLARAGRMVGADCADWPLILPPEGAAIHGTVRAWLTAAGIGRARALFETVSPAFGRRAVELSDALWFISSGVVAEDLGAGRLAALPLRGPMLAGPIGISLREDATPPIELDALLAALRRVAREEEP